MTTRFASGFGRAPFRQAALAATLASAAPIAAHAQTVSLASPDPYGIYTIQGENDAVSTQKGTSDRYYTSGLRLGWTSPEDILPAGLDNLGHVVMGQGRQRIALGLQQSIYTPDNTQIALPPTRSRPYAGVLIGTATLINDTALSRSTFGIQAGVLGPWALGRQVQNGFHDIIGDTENRGWDTQRSNQPIFQVDASRTWRLPVIGAYGIGVDVLPAVSAEIGNLRDSVMLGSTLRIGQGLDSDFGVSRISPGLSGGDAYRNTRTFAWYAFAGVDGQAVGYDALLDGSTTDYARPSKIWDVGEMQAGLALLYHGVRLSYTQTWQTQEFRGQKAGLFNFGSLALSAKF